MINMKHTPTTTTTTEAQMDKLTPRQKQVVVLFNQGNPVKAIAQELGVKTVTVYGALKAANRKLGIKGRLRKASWKKYKPGKPVVNKPANPALQAYLSGLSKTLGRNVKAGSVHISANFHGQDSVSSPESYRQAKDVVAGLDQLAAAAKAAGRTFVRRDFIVSAIAAKLKEVLS
jgi:DNA-binding CsgD family transcriptional regulator